MKERRQGREGYDEFAFRTWLEQVAFPTLVADSGRMLQALHVSQKAHSEELRKQLSGQLDEIQATLRSLLDGQPSRPTFEARWSTLGPHAHDLMHQLRSGALDDDYRAANLTIERGSVESEEAQRRLDESGLVTVHSYSGANVTRLTALGYLVTVAAEDPLAFRAQLVRIQAALQRGWAPVDKVVALTQRRCSVALVHAVAEQWDRAGWVSLQELDQRSRSRINQPSQALAEATEKQLFLKALTPFLSAFGEL